VNRTISIPTTLTGAAATCTRVYSGISATVVVANTGGTLVEDTDYTLSTPSSGYINVTFLGDSDFCPTLDGVLNIDVTEYKVEDVSGCECESVIDNGNPITGAVTITNGDISTAVAACPCP
jgi:hypothetical protein